MTGEITAAIKGSLRKSAQKVLEHSDETIEGTAELLKNLKLKKK